MAKKNKPIKRLSKNCDIIKEIIKPKRIAFKGLIMKPAAVKTLESKTIKDE